MIRATIYPGPLGREAWTVETPLGPGRIWVDAEDRSAHPSRAHVWELGGQGGRAYSRDYALRRVLRAGMVAPAPVEIPRLELLELAVVAEEGSPIDAAKILRSLLHRRTGRSWSVRVGSGKRRSELSISSKPKVRWRGVMTAEDAALLAAVLDVEFIGGAGIALGGRVGERSRAVLAAAGVRGRDLEALAWPAPRRE